jgi:cysteine synthase A
MQKFDNIIQTIGNTPLVALNRVVEHYNLKSRLYAKLEYFNPGGSVKDRAALMIIEEAEKSGEFTKGQRIVELTSGNMGIGLAIVSAIKGYRFTAVMSKGNSPERWRILKALGAKVILVPQAKGGEPGKVTGEDLEVVERKTRQLVEKFGAFRPDQFNNPGNALAHELGTGEEIWRQLDGRLDYFVAIVGSAGTFVGTARALKKHNPDVKCFAVEPANAAILAGKIVKSTQHKIQGTGYAFIPPQWDPKLCDGYLAVTDEESMNVSRMLAKMEGILSGFSGGANVAAALKLARKIKRDKIIVTIIPDNSLKYLSTDLYE